MSIYDLPWISDPRSPRDLHHAEVYELSMRQGEPPIQLVAGFGATSDDEWTPLYPRYRTEKAPDVWTMDPDGRLWRNGVRTMRYARDLRPIGENLQDLIQAQAASDADAWPDEVLQEVSIDRLLGGNEGICDDFWGGWCGPDPIVGGDPDW